MILAILVSAHSLASSNPHVDAATVTLRTRTLTTPVTVTPTVTVYPYHCTENTGTAIVTQILSATPTVTVTTVTPPMTRTPMITATVTITYGTWIWEGVTSPWTVHVTEQIVFTATVAMTCEVSAIDDLRDLTSYVEAMALEYGIENALTSKLENAIRAIERRQINAAIGMLEAFVDQVRSLEGKKLSAEQANYLMQQAQAIIDTLRS